MREEKDYGMRARILEGMATILWATAWAEHVEEARCSSLSGCEITEVMPRLPEMAEAHAEALALAFEVAALPHRGEYPSAFFDEPVTVADLFIRACEDGGITEVTHEMGYMAERFGNCLAFMAQGDGVSWFDDYPEFPLAVPAAHAFAASDLRYHADSTCDDCKRRHAARREKRRRFKLSRMTRAQRGLPAGYTIGYRRQA